MSSTIERTEASPAEQRLDGLNKIGSRAKGQVLAMQNKDGKTITLQVATPAEKNLPGKPEWTPNELQMLERALAKHVHGLIVKCINKPSTLSDTKPNEVLSSNSGTEEQQALPKEQEFDPNNPTAGWKPVDAKTYVQSHVGDPPPGEEPRNVVDEARAMLLPGYEPSTGEEGGTYKPYRSGVHQANKPTKDPSTFATEALQAINRGNRQKKNK